MRTTPRTTNTDSFKTLGPLEAWDAGETIRIIKWWLSKTKKRKRLAMAVGGFNEVVQEVCLNLLRYPPKHEVALTTAICNHTSWTLARMCAKICEIEFVSDCPDIAGPDTVTNTAVAHEQSLNLRRILCETLSGRTAGVVWDRMQGATFQEIGDRLGVSQERARQIDCRGIHQLRQMVCRISKACDIRALPVKEEQQ
jgi:DNA-directed RNA polymerase specialized sigma subunit